MALTQQDKVLLGGALTLALASAGVFGWFTLRHAGPAEIPPVQLVESPYDAKAPSTPPIKAETWAAPVAQSRGREWIYDTFTPPEIFYNTRSRQFTVKPPSSLVDDDQLEVFGVELVSVKPEPFRLQLIGYSGGEGTWRGTFVNVPTGEVIVAGSGHRVAKLGLVIKSLEVAAQAVRIGESMPVRQTVATAVILDEKTRRETTITNRERVFTGTVFAFVALPGSTATREVRAGDSFLVGDATFRVEKVETSPPSIEIAKEAPTLTQPDRRTLTPRESDADAEREPGP
ncbi:MAG: hypothetical protein Q8N18_02005 [Opitutaceae bacterium]|nr:hypothetical protein [Opitutaceae bacterium]